MLDSRLLLIFPTNFIFLPWTIIANGKVDIRQYLLCYSEDLVLASRILSIDISIWLASTQICKSINTYMWIVSILICELYLYLYVNCIYSSYKHKIVNSIEIISVRVYLHYNNWILQEYINLMQIKKRWSLKIIRYVHMLLYAKRRSMFLNITRPQNDYKTTFHPIYNPNENSNNVSVRSSIH